MPQKNQITSSELKTEIDSGKNFLFFDVRPREDAARWKLEARGHHQELNVPYREMVQQGGKPDAIDSIKNFVSSKLANSISPNREIVTICAKGISSEDLTDALVGLGYHARTLAGGLASWALFYQFKPVTESKALSIYQVSRPARGCLSYMIASGDRGVVVDPLRHIGPYLNFVLQHKLKIEAVIDTHGHADHISGGKALADAVGAPYYLHPYDAIHPIDVLPAELDYQYLQEAQEFSFGQASIKAIHIPGHTLGNTAFLVNNKYLLTGDSIFINSIARPDLGGRGDTWAPIHFGSLSRLLALPDSTLILPGHFSRPDEAGDDGLFAATLEQLKKSNEGVHQVLRGKAVFVQYILENLPEFPPQYVEIKRVNAGLLKPDDEKASELELGRNICALAKAY